MTEAPGSVGPRTAPENATPESAAAEATTPASPAPGPAPAEPAPASRELEDRWRRAVAETDNVRKRYERQAADERSDERSRVATEWLPVLDNLELALGHARADPEAIIAGVETVREQALAVLKRLGFTRIEDIGARFDPSRHEAAQVMEVPGAAPGTVVAVLRPGYRAADRLLRPAVVVVAGKPD
jgi:molecular chaperone GrpE